MTEEQKQALIEWLKPQIDELQNVSDEIPFGLDSDSAMHLNTMRVALAALTAPPVGYIRANEAELIQRLKKHSVVELAIFKTQAFRDDVAVFTSHAASTQRAADLAELVPNKWSLEQALKFIEDYTPPSEEESVLFAVNSFRAAILRKIEEEK